MKRLSVIAVAALWVVACSKPQEKPLTGIITFANGEVKVNSAAAKAGARVAAKDVVTTGEKSTAVIQFAANAVITLKANTEINVAELSRQENGKPAIAVAQNSGSTFSKVLKGESDYKVNTPTAVAGVRGTSFEVAVDKDKRSIVRLLEGKVVVSSPEKPEAEPVIVEAGQEIAAGADKIEAPVAMKAEVIEELNKLDKIEILSAEKVDEIQKAPEPEKILEEIKVVPAETVEQLKSDLGSVKETLVDEIKIDKQVGKKMTLDDLRKKYSTLSRITTKDGKTYIGAFSQKGTKMVVTTVDGEVEIPITNVKKIDQI